MAVKPDAVVAFEDVKAFEREKLLLRREERKSPLPRDLDRAPPTGLALSGGGIRSAAVCLGAIQALHSRRSFKSLDYLSTVSGGGYTGACISAAMSDYGGAQFPFGADSRNKVDNFKDSAVVGHIRNYSNYLLPRSRSAIRNWTEAASIILRGLLANAVCVLAFVFPAVWLTAIAFPARDDPHALVANFIPRLLSGRIDWPSPFAYLLRLARDNLPDWPFLIQNKLLQVLTSHADRPFFVPALLAGMLAAVLLVWAVLRSRPRLDRMTDDTSSGFLSLSHVVVALLVVAFAIDLQPLAIRGLIVLNRDWASYLAGTMSVLTAFMGTISTVASSLGKFLNTSRRSDSRGTNALRFATRAAMMIAALVLPLLVWWGYMELYLWVVPERSVSVALNWSWLRQNRLASLIDWSWLPQTRLGLLFQVALGLWIIMLSLRANGYSLHRLYRDRLSAAFLVSADDGLQVQAAGTWTQRRSLRHLQERADDQDDLPPLDLVKLSHLQASKGPYPLINAALNVQGSHEANRRGRNADFFVFTPEHVGSDLTGYAPVEKMQAIDSRLDLATAMAISGAAASANMGGNTVRALSPTLSLLNIRLGYYLANPGRVYELNTPRRWWSGLGDRFFLFIEMFNGLTEKRATVYLTDGGHIENLGIYPLLKRRCALIVAIDSEADPELSAQSLLKLERFARIDEGIRIVLPWEQIARTAHKAAATLSDEQPACERGPHCAVGKIFYPEGKEGLLVYVKSSLSGDEKDYILDYAKRNPSFPHETTGDQFFSEEQFEMYRALGFHMMDGAFESDRLAFLKGRYGFANQTAARAAFKDALSGKVKSAPSAKQSGKRT